mmetsp:Transcript_47001/g.155774  ORF Transcript_47001/g.155774 Transcript_47001/m.155774 type:complete len:149 (-) Transcript_47001:110-556(-)
MGRLPGGARRAAPLGGQLALISALAHGGLRLHGQLYYAAGGGFHRRVARLQARPDHTVCRRSQGNIFSDVVGLAAAGPIELALKRLRVRGHNLTPAHLQLWSVVTVKYRGLQPGWCSAACWGWCRCSSRRSTGCGRRDPLSSTKKITR